MSFRHPLFSFCTRAGDCQQEFQLLLYPIRFFKLIVFECMKKNSVLYLFTTLIICFLKPTYAQHTADSLHRLIDHAQGKKKGELILELANHFLVSHPDSSIHYALIAKEAAEKINNHVLVIRSFTLSGEAYQKQNKLKESVASYLKGVELAEKHQEKSLLGTLYNGIGTCYFYMNNIKKSEEYLKRAVQAKKEANDYQYYALIAANLASIQIVQTSYDQAITTLHEAEKTLLDKHQLNYLGSVYNSLGAAFQMAYPQSDSSSYYYEKSFEASSRNKDYLVMMNASQNLGDYYLSKKKYTVAIDYMKKAIAINDLRKVDDQYKPILYDRISIVYDSLGDYKNAHHYKKMQLEANEHLLSILQKKEIEELEIKYQSEKKEKEIQLQKQEIEKGKNQRNTIVLITIFLFLILGFCVYFILQRRKILQRYEQEKLRLFENLVHEIRTPLTLIDGPIQIMKQSETADQKQLYLMERNAKKLIGLINELLDASKLGKGSYQLHFNTGNPDEFIASVIETYSGELAANEIEVTFKRSDPSNTCSYPFNVLEKVIGNLLGNVINYCPAGTRVIISSEMRADALTIEVRDNGKGIPRNEQKKVFRRFYRGKNNPDVGGTGIGLSLVKELVELVNGTIRLESSQAGTTFTVSLPVVNTDHSPEVASYNENAPTLLLAEDDDDMAVFTERILREQFNLIRTANGQKAIEAIRKQLPDIVLSDVMMPQKDGIELLQEIKSDELTNHIPVVLFSAKASLESRLQGLKYGADAYIAKPFSPDELQWTLQNLLTTIQRNKDTYKATVQTQAIFEERIKSPHAYINKAIGYVIRNIDNPEYSVNELSDDMAVSRSQLHRKLTALTGFSATNFIRMIRLEKAKDLLSNNEGNITEIAYKCGFNSQSYFTRSFTEYVGKSPSQMIGKH